MPSTNARMILTLKPDLHTAIKEFAAASEKPAATVVVELLTEFQPQMLELTRVLLMISRGKVRAARSHLAQMMGSTILAATQMDIPLEAARPERPAVSHSKRTGTSSTVRKRGRRPG